MKMKKDIPFKWTISYQSLLLVKSSSPLIKVNNGILFVALELVNKWIIGNCKYFKVKIASTMKGLFLHFEKPYTDYLKCKFGRLYVSWK